MSVLRLAMTMAAMAVMAVLLAVLSPSLPDIAAALSSPQRTVDTAGPDTLVLSAAGALAWAVWGWGALGLALTAATAVPGVLGDVAEFLLHATIPAGARRSAAVVLGVGLGVAGPLAATATSLVPLPAAVAAPGQGVPDWPPTAAPASTPQAVPDWPSGPDVSEQHVVVRGDCLWQIAAGRLADQLGRSPSNGEVATAVHAWWTANADVIGPDPDLLLPGQVLHPPI